jgi:hypothetical protein
MPAQTWANSEQLEWLKAQRVGFAQAQEEKKLPAFWVDVNRQFFARWPDQASEIETDTGGKRKGKEKEILPESPADWVKNRKKVCVY